MLTRVSRDSVSPLDLHNALYSCALAAVCAQHLLSALPYKGADGDTQQAIAYVARVATQLLEL